MPNVEMSPNLTRTGAEPVGDGLDPFEVLTDLGGKGPARAIRGCARLVVDVLDGDGDARRKGLTKQVFVADEECLPCGGVRVVRLIHAVGPDLGHMHGEGVDPTGTAMVDLATHGVLSFNGAGIFGPGQVWQVPGQIYRTFVPEGAQLMDDGRHLIGGIQGPQLEHVQRMAPGLTDRFQRIAVDGPAHRTMIGQRRQQGVLMGPADGLHGPVTGSRSLQQRDPGWPAEGLVRVQALRNDLPAASHGSTPREMPVTGQIQFDRMSGEPCLDPGP